ncbi:GNAT family N-acetyltransferase [Haloechinothrix sp. LS1_15]|uniref:GNAT family N-acetyltransferase n=1 Tax=Haloechinothrix sp. LS1_15 TaxID=2652248 RepID=UPI0029474960|nr:GNAT family N-acetyltransferase [Haloechinothrix sp. LS1_15]MDV6014346.1 GNAT family N-acetyltransferase [Haloechinothrix sp. LS1_15]
MATAPPHEDVTIRTGPRPGDLGTVLHMHGEIYAREYGFTEEFEAHVAHGLARFAARLGAAREDPGLDDPGCLWLAKSKGVTVGTIALTNEGAGTAQLRWFLVAPAARGGLGHQLLDTTIAHARQCDYHRITLWTVDGLDAAASLYTRAGFTRSEHRPVHQWGRDLVEARWELQLRA